MKAGLIAEVVQRMETCSIDPFTPSLLAFLASGSPPSPLNAALPLFIAIIAITVAIMVVVILHRKARSNKYSHLAGQHPHHQLQAESGTKRELEVLMIELDELAKQLMGRLDSRFAKLEGTIRDADERIDRLNRMIRAQQGKAALDITVHEDGADGAFSTEKSESKAPEPPDPHASIHRLADQGLSAVEIASQIGRSTGEIELILSLRRVKEQAVALSARR